MFKKAFKDILHIALAVKDSMCETVRSFLVREFICAECEDTWLIRSNLTERKNGNRPKFNKRDRNFSCFGFFPGWTFACRWIGCDKNNPQLPYNHPLTFPCFSSQDFLSPLGCLVCAPRCGEGAQSNLSAGLYLFHCYHADWREKDLPWFWRRLESSWQQRKKISASPTFPAWKLWQWRVLPTRSSLLFLYEIIISK